MQLVRPIKTRFRFGFGASRLNLATHRNSLARSTKSTWSHMKSASTACKHRVSGSISLPSRGSFHLSLTVLCAIGHRLVFSLGGWSPLLPTRFLVSRGTLEQNLRSSSFAYGPVTLYGEPFQVPSAGIPPRHYSVRNPKGQVLWFGLFPFRSPLLGKSSFLSLPAGT